MAKFKFDELDFWNHEHAAVSSKETDEELDLKFKTVYYDCIKKGRVTKSNRDKFYEIICDYWRRIILTIEFEMTEFIKNKKPRSQPFRPFLKRIKDIDMKLAHDPDLAGYSNIYDDVQDIYEEIMEIIAIEKAEKRWSIKQILIGFALGIVASVVATAILILIGIVN
ncbi:MAG: hypothetical protein NT120_02185 [Candidatus Aenigmarchaeota archaeon]|nr:hypothetical protein [Candidatus Aenigmarchaeota archaeon]